MSELPFDVEAGPQQTLHGETVVFTGKLWSLGRKEARSVVERLGGTPADDVTLKTTLLVVGGETYPDGVPDTARLANDTSTHSQKLRRAAQVNVEQPPRIRIISEDDFCRSAGLPPVAELREKHYGQRDILAMYPALREDHLQYLQKWGFIRPAFKNNADTFFGFSDLTLLRQVHAEVQQGVSFRGVLRDLQATRSGQLAFDFRIDAHPARIITLKPREVSPPRGGVLAAHDRADFDPTTFPITPAEQYFLMGSLLDDGTPERQEEAAQAYRRALEDDPDLVAALINLANIRYARDELAEAQALYERAILLDASYFEAHFNLGNIHHDHGRYHDAEECYVEALQLNSSYADAHFYLAVTLEKMGRSADARQHWRDYRSLAPEGEWVELAREFSD
ncbi:MAG TPA: tetratricopeptide repeat protein [Vicinamibacterales bacterium]|nr:tetratricopeptide repeat protein [Vicinamibacterales bacterium]